VYEERRRVLEGEDLEDQIKGFMDDVVTGLVGEYTAAGTPESWDLDGLWNELRNTYPVSITPEDIVAEAGNATRVSAEMLIEELQSDMRLSYQARESELGEDVMRQLERRVVLSVLDRKWREHLYEMDYLKEGIGLRAMAQRDPLVEYQREGYQLFQAMNEAIKEESVRYLFNIEVKPPEERAAPAGPVVTATSAATTAAGATVGATARKAAPAPAAPAVEPDLLGLEAPERPTRLSYSASALDGNPTSGPAAVVAEQDGESPAAQNREARRAAAKAARKQS